MMTSRTYHSLNLDIATCDSSNIIYVLLPERLTEEELVKVQELSERFESNIVAISGMNWSSDMSPWKVSGIKDIDYGGQAVNFLNKLKEDIFFNLEISLKLTNVKRYLVGTSLSGMFAIWSAAKKQLFEGIASISGSFWFDGFIEWLQNQNDFKCMRFHILLGDKEKDTKNKRIAEIEDATMKTVEILIEKGVDVSFEMIEGGHISPIIPRLEKSLLALIGNQSLDY